MSAYIMKRGLATLLITTALTLPVWSAENCKVVEETDQYISTNCFDEAGKFTGGSISAKPVPGLVIEKVEKGTFQIDSNKIAKNIIDSIKEPETPVIKIRDGEILPLADMLNVLVSQSDAVAAARKDYEASVHSLKSAYSAYYPNASMTYGYNEENDRTPSQSNNAESITNLSKHGPKKSLTITQMIWDFGRTNINVDIAKQNAQSAQVKLEMTTEDLIVEGITAYLNIIKTWNTLQGNKEIEDNAKKALAMTMEKVKKGEASKVEQLQIEQQYRTFQTMTVQSEIAYNTAQQTFIKLYGINPPAGDKFFIPKENLLGDMPDKPVKFLANRNLRLADYDKIVARLSRDLAKKNFEPTIDSTFSITDYEKDLGGGYGTTKTEWRFDITLRWTLFNGFKNTNDYKAMMAKSEASELRYKEVYRNIQEQVNNIFMNYEKLKDNIATLERTAKINQEMYTLTLKEYSAGKSPLIAVFGMKTASIMAETGLKNAQIDVLIQRFNLHKIIGSIHNPNMS